MPNSSTERPSSRSSLPYAINLEGEEGCVQGAALLISALASLISAIGGVGLAWWAMRRGSRTERQDAAEGAAERLMRPAEMDQNAIETTLLDYYVEHHNEHQPSPPHSGREVSSDD